LRRKRISIRGHATEVAADQLTGVFDADRTHSSFQFGVRHMNVSTFRASFDDVDARLIARDGQVESKAWRESNRARSPAA